MEIDINILIIVLGIFTISLSVKNYLKKRNTFKEIDKHFLDTGIPTGILVIDEYNAVKVMNIHAFILHLRECYDKGKVDTSSYFAYRTVVDSFNVDEDIPVTKLELQNFLERDKPYEQGDFRIRMTPCKDKVYIIIKCVSVLGTNFQETFYKTVKDSNGNTPLELLKEVTSQEPIYEGIYK